MINRTLDNRYTLLEHVGSGGMADVYRAHDKLLDRSVAVKILRSQFTNDEEFVSRFRREARAAAKLSHPNIVNIYDVGRDENTYYIIMEYISGETLKELIERERTIPVEKAMRIALEIADALEQAHQNNLIHCDIKPHNILITKGGRVKVTDFGIARAVTSVTMTHSGTVIGSVHYFSPEQAKGIAIDAKSDIYSLGVVMYEMLVGNVPFTGETPVSIALKHLQEEPKPLTHIDPLIPPLVEAIVLKAMAKDLSVRYSDIGEMITDLRLAKNYLRDDNTRRLSKDDFPTQLLPKITPPETAVSTKQIDAPTESRAATKSKLFQNRLWMIVPLLLLGFMLGAFLAYGKFWSPNEVVVPDVAGKQVDVARNILLSQNLRVTITETFNEKVPVGNVISQNPEAGTTVKEQRSIILVVSKGGEITSVPDLKGLNRRDAELQLKNAGLVVGRVDEQYSDDVQPDIVISQNPRAPAQISKNTPVDLVVSKGAAPRKVILPDFRGTPLNTVNTQLGSLKLKVGNVSEQPSDTYPAGIIMGQNPLPGSEVSEGATIDLIVAKGVSGKVKRASVQITVPEGPIRQAVQIMVTDVNGRRVAYEGVHKSGEKLEKTVEGVGTIKVQIYVNGALLQEQTL